MLRVHLLSKSLGGRPLFERLSFVVQGGERLGVVGPNGCGKTTLLRTLAGELSPDAGHVEWPGDAAPQLLRQGYGADRGRRAGDLFPLASADPPAARRLEEVAADLAAATDDREAGRLVEEYDRALALLEGAVASGAIDETAAELGVTRPDPSTPASRLSPGELAKLALLEIVARHPDAVLLDEPTNHLDGRGIEWLESFLQRFRGPLVLVSHDRALLDRVVGHILDLDPRLPAEERLFTGGYSAYAEARAAREAAAWERYLRERREERRVRREISAIESRARSVEQRTIHFHYRKRAAKVARRATTLKARLERRLQSPEHAERPAKPSGGLGGAFETAGRTASRLLSAEGVALSIAGRQLLSGGSFTVDRGERVVLRGANGAGKTTLLRAVLGEIDPQAGRLRIAASAEIGYLAQEQQRVSTTAEEGWRAVDYLRRAVADARSIAEAEAFDLMHRFLFGHDRAVAPLRELSHGERRRLELARLVIRGADLLLLDEPTNHLDIPSRESFEQALAAFEGGALIVTHDRYFIDRYADRVIEIEDGVLRAVARSGGAG